AVGPVFAHQRAQPLVDVQQPVRERRGRRRGDGAADDDAMMGEIGFDAAVARALRAGVDAEDSHASEASISFSSMSKFDATFCTSSWSSSPSISLIICCAGLPSSLT